MLSIDGFIKTSPQLTNIQDYTESPLELEKKKLQKREQEEQAKFQQAAQLQQPQPQLTNSFQSPQPPSTTNQSNITYIPTPAFPAFTVPSFKSHPTLEKFLTLTTNFTTTPPPPETAKSLVKFKRVSTMNSINLITSFALINLNQPEIFGTILLFWTNFYEGARNFISEKASLRSKMLILPRIIHVLGDKFPVNLVNFSFPYLLQTHPTVVGAYRQQKQHNLDGVTAMFWLGILTVTGVNAAGIFAQIADSWKYILEDVEKTCADIVFQQEVEHILACFEGIVLFVREQEQIDKVSCRAIFDYNPYGEGVQGQRFLVFFQSVFSLCKQKAMFNYLNDVINE